MPEQRALRITSLRERIERAEYHVDADKVAEAILSRPTAHLLIIPGRSMSAEGDDDAVDDDDGDQPTSEDVLEAA
jgi:hypothetical protein